MITEQMVEAAFEAAKRYKWVDELTVRECAMIRSALSAALSQKAEGEAGKPSLVMTVSPETTELIERMKKEYGVQTSSEVLKEALRRARVPEALPREQDGAGAVAWAAERWKDEVANRPLQNIHRSALDVTWRQVIRHFGGDPEALCGPDHRDLVDAAGDSYAHPPARDGFSAGQEAMREALAPFAAVAEHDISEDEHDSDLFRPMNKYNRVRVLTIGDLRRANAALKRANEESAA